jgi:hypothetical protein
MKYVPVPSAIMVRKLNALSNALGWGKLDGRAVLFDDGSAPAMYWCSESLGDMTLDIHAIQRTLSADAIAQRKTPFGMLQINAVSYRFRIYAGPVFFSLPPEKEIPDLAQVLAPLLHVSNFSSPAARRDLVKRYPTARVPKVRPRFWKSTEMKILDGKIVVDEAKRLYWKRRFAQFKRRVSGTTTD